MGYVGAPAGYPHCLEIGCNPTDKTRCNRTIHAEQNALVHTVSRGTSLYCTHLPCLSCLKLCIASGIEDIIYYTNREDMEVLEYISANRISHYKRAKDVESWGIFL